MRALRNKMLAAYTIGLRTGSVHNDILDVVVLVLLVLWLDKIGLRGWCIAFRHWARVVASGLPPASPQLEQ